MGELDGRRALVTGGTTGIGRAIVEAFLREGARVVFTGRDVGVGDRVAAEVGEASAFLAADASDPERIRASVSEAIATLGGLDVLVNNAGIGVLATPLNTPLEDYERVMDVNVRGYFLYAVECFPHLEAAHGNMVHISSDAAILGEVEIGIYSVSKAAVNMLSNMLAVEGARRGVRSNAICPGDTEPGMRHMGPPGDSDRPAQDPPTWSLPPVGNVGYVHFEDLVGPRHWVHDVKGARIVGADSSEPDLNEGQIGRERYDWLRQEFGAPADLRILALHHHLIPVPGTGRERSTVMDAGDLLELLITSGVNVVLSGHKHVPYVWRLEDMYVANAGTVASLRLRGYTKPCYNVMEFEGDEVKIHRRFPFGSSDVIAHFGLSSGEQFHRLIEPPVQERA